MSKTFVIGDIHGSYRALLQCLELSSFNYHYDQLICLGDISDGWPETREAIDEMLKIRNLTFLLGNHDFWTLEWMETGYADSTWLAQGGAATVRSYGSDIPRAHHELLKTARPFHILNDQLFVHAGINPAKALEDQGLSTFLWDRSLAAKAQYHEAQGEPQKLTEFEAVFVGHTPIKEDRPKQFCEIWMMDTGAGWSGRLSMMNVDSGETFVSDPVPELYPGVAGRKKF